MGIINSIDNTTMLREKNGISIYKSNDNLYFVAFKATNVTGKILPVIDINKDNYFVKEDETDSYNKILDMVNDTYTKLNNKADNTMLIIFDFDKLKSIYNNLTDIVNNINKVINSLEKELNSKNCSIYESIFVLEKKDLDKKVRQVINNTRKNMENTNAKIAMSIPYNTIYDTDSGDTTSKKEEIKSERVYTERRFRANGFINTILFISLLLGTTVFSIELGKILYLVFGK